MRFPGIIPAVTTPFDATGAIDHESLAGNLAALLDAGADALMLLPPLGYRGDPEEIVAYYRAVAEAAGLPLMAYNNPEASGTDMRPALIARLYEEIEPVVAVKEC